MKALTLSLAALLLASVASTTAAAAPLLRPGTRAMWASVGLGPAAELDTVSTQFKLTQTFGYHFSGSSSGPALALELQESFGKGVLFLEVGPKFVWDIQLIDGIGFYLSPSAMAGFAHASNGGSLSGFTLQLGVEAKLVLGDRGMVFFRPVCVDIIGLSSGDLHVGSRWDLIFGGGVTF
jgi:hypothetical protein